MCIIHTFNKQSSKIERYRRRQETQQHVMILLLSFYYFLLISYLFLIQIRHYNAHKLNQGGHSEVNQVLIRMHPVGGRDEASATARSLPAADVVNGVPHEPHLLGGVSAPVREDVVGHSGIGLVHAIETLAIQHRYEGIWGDICSLCKYFVCYIYIIYIYIWCSQSSVKLTMMYSRCRCVYYAR
jgi:hypothetical protein